MKWYEEVLIIYSWILSRSGPDRKVRGADPVTVHVSEITSKGLSEVSFVTREIDREAEAKGLSTRPRRPSADAKSSQA